MRTRSSRGSRRERSARPCTPNDHVNMSQSSNDSIPSAIHVARGARAHAEAPAGARASGRDDRGEGARGRRHREDRPHAPDGRDAGAARSGARRLGRADPRRHLQRSQGVLPRLTGLAQGGTAVGTGINAHPKFGAEFAAVLAKQTRRRFPSGRGLLRGAEQPGHGRRAVGPAQDDGREPHEDRERPALDEQRPARRARARSRCRPCSPAAASCPAR